MHIHKFMRIPLGSPHRVVYKDGRRCLEKKESRYEVFRCMIPGCTTYYPRELVIGQKSICWSCCEELILTSQNTTKKKPTHKECKKQRAA
jgi:hypothetical protein